MALRVVCWSRGQGPWSCGSARLSSDWSASPQASQARPPHPGRVSKHALASPRKLQPSLSHRRLHATDVQSDHQLLQRITRQLQCVSRFFRPNRSMCLSTCAAAKTNGSPWPPASEHASELSTRSVNISCPTTFAPCINPPRVSTSVTIVPFLEHHQVILMSTLSSQYFVLSMYSASVDACFAISESPS
jgi:hypothetical protein